MSADELVNLQQALVWVFGPVLISAIPLVFALGTLVALLTAMLTFLAPRAKSAGVQS